MSWKKPSSYTDAEWRQVLAAERRCDEVNRRERERAEALERQQEIAREKERAQRQGRTAHTWGHKQPIMDTPGSRTFYEKVKIDKDGVEHRLIAPAGVNIDENHIHVKKVNGQYVCCQVKEDGRAVTHGRRKFVERINALTGANIKP